MKREIFIGVIIFVIIMIFSFFIYNKGKNDKKEIVNQKKTENKEIKNPVVKKNETKKTEKRKKSKKKRIIAKRIKVEKKEQPDQQKNEEKKEKQTKELDRVQIQGEVKQLFARSANKKFKPLTVNESKFKFLTEYNGHKYYLSKISLPWPDAEKFCIKNGGYLATITSSAENSALKKVLSVRASIWIGLFRDGGLWYWVTGENYDYTNWGGMEPDGDYYVIEKFAFLAPMFGNMQWADQDEAACYFIMERNN